MDIGLHSFYHKWTSLNLDKIDNDQLTPITTPSRLTVARVMLSLPNAKIWPDLVLFTIKAAAKSTSEGKAANHNALVHLRQCAVAQRVIRST